MDFGGADIGEQFIAEEAQFLNEKKKANFNGMKVGQSAFFQKATFKGPVDFLTADIGGQLGAREARFQSREEAKFEGIKVAMGAFFEGAEFAGLLALNDAYMLDLQMGDKSIPGLSLERTCINRELSIQETEIGVFAAGNLVVQGPATLENVVIKDAADLRHARFQQVKFVKVTWPERQAGKARVWLDGINFQALSTRKEPEEEEDWNRVLGWISLSRFNTQIYQLLDEYFQRCGLKDWAYKVFVAGKRREWSRWRQLRRWRKWWAPALWLNKVFWDWLTGFGRKPARTLFLIIPLVLVGWLLFEPQFDIKFLETHSSFRSMVLQYPKITGLLLSLDRFLPTVDLGLAKHWQPCQLCCWTWIYWYFLKIMGWVTIPITLAAIYTKIK